MLKFLLRLAGPWAWAWLALSPAVSASEEISAPAQAQPSAVGPFIQYRPWRDEPVANWRQVNDRVRDVGGWRTYLRESQQNGNGTPQGGHEHHGH